MHVVEWILDSDRDACVLAKNQFLQDKNGSQLDDISCHSSHVVGSSSSQKSKRNHPDVNEENKKDPKKNTTVNSNEKLIRAEKQTSAPSSTISTSSDNQSEELIDENFLHSSNARSSATIVSNYRPNGDSMFDADIVSCPITRERNEDDENNVLLEELKKLNVKVQNQAQSIKERDAEIKRLKLTTIGSFSISFYKKRPSFSS